MKIVYVPCFYKKKLSDKLLKRLLDLKEKRVGIFSTLQFSRNLNELKHFLEKNNKIVFLGKSKKLNHKGQVLGCDISSCEMIKDKVDCFLFLGSGKFHPILVALKTNKKTYIANPLTDEISEISFKEIEALKRSKKKNLIKFKNAKYIGILVSTKVGQLNLEEAIKIKKEIEKSGRKAFIFVFDTLIPEELMNFPQIDAWVNTACPRIAIDDLERFEKPIINMEDFYASI
jgi:2-(3-amino-3-carboxypropyl)histidine synthase